MAPGPLAEARIDRPAVPVAEAAGTSTSAQQAGEAKGTAGDDGTSILAQQAGEAKGTAGDDGTSTSAQQAGEFMAEETRIAGPEVAAGQAGGTSGGEAGGAAGEFMAEQVTAPAHTTDTDPTDLVQHGSKNAKNCVKRATRQLGRRRRFLLTSSPSSSQ